MVDLNALVAFDERTLNANGDPLGPWAERFRCRANVDYLRGSESAVASRLEGRQPANITIRDNVTTRAVTAAWRARVIAGRRVRAGDTFNIQAAAPGRDLGFINLIGLAGVADG